MLIVADLEAFHYAEATAMAVVLLTLSFADAGRHQPPRTLEQTSWGVRPLLPTARARTQANAGDGPRPRRGTQDPLWVRVTLTAAALAVIGAADRRAGGQRVRPGLRRRRRRPTWTTLFGDRDTRSAILLTLTVAPVAVVLNVVFGVAAAWAIARFRFPGRTLLLTLIDLPFSVSPVVAGLVFVLLFGLQGYFGAFLRQHGQGVVVAGLAAALLAVRRGPAAAEEQRRIPPDSCRS